MPAVRLVALRETLFSTIAPLAAPLEKASRQRKCVSVGFRRVTHAQSVPNRSRPATASTPAHSGRVRSRASNLNSVHSTMVDSADVNACKVCKQNPAKYKCPTCRLP